MRGISKLVGLAGLLGSFVACNALFGIGDGFVTAEGTADGALPPDSATDAKPGEPDAEAGVVDSGAPVPSHLAADSSSFRWDSTFSLKGSLKIQVENEGLRIADGNDVEIPVPTEWWAWNRGCSCVVLSLDRLETSGATDAGPAETITIRQDAPLIVVAQTVVLDGFLEVLADLVDASAVPSVSDGKPAADGGMGGGGGGGGRADGGNGGNGSGGAFGAGGLTKTVPSQLTIFTPLTVGARGAPGGRGCLGGVGGGALQISATSLTVRGTVVANGAGGALCLDGGGGGGGAGGMLWFESPIRAMTLVDSTLGANGGGGAAGATPNGAPGPGGETSTSAALAAGGSHTVDAGAATGGRGGNGGGNFGGNTTGVGGGARNSTAGGGGGGGGSAGFVLHRGAIASSPEKSSPPLSAVGP